MARNESKLNDVASKCRATGAADVLVCQADLAKEEECVKAVSETVAKFGGWLRYAMDAIWPVDKQFLL